MLMSQHTLNAFLTEVEKIAGTERTPKPAAPTPKDPLPAVPIHNMREIVKRNPHLAEDVPGRKVVAEGGRFYIRDSKGSVDFDTMGSAKDALKQLDEANKSGAKNPWGL